MKWILPLFAFGCVVGCSPTTTSTGDPAKKVTWDEYQKMDPEQKDDPYVVDNLDDDAKKKLAEFQRKKKR